MKTIGALVMKGRRYSQPGYPVAEAKGGNYALPEDGAEKLTLTSSAPVRQRRGDYLGCSSRNYIDFTRRHGDTPGDCHHCVPVDEATRKEMAGLISGEKPGSIEFTEQLTNQSLVVSFQGCDSYIDASVRKGSTDSGRSFTGSLCRKVDNKIYRYD
jgi:hypothetical protein